MIKGHKIEKKVNTESFLDNIKQHDEKDVVATNHTFFRLKEKERKVFKDRIIKDVILSQTPILVGLQYNKNHAVFYKYDKDTLKIILDIQPAKISIVTFYIIDNDQVPRI
jgi:hypothetical protein